MVLGAGRLRPRSSLRELWRRVCPMPLAPASGHWLAILGTLTLQKLHPNLCLRLHTILSLWAHLCPNFPFLWVHQSFWNRGLSCFMKYNLILIHVQQSSFQIRSHGQVLDTWHLGGSSSPRSRFLLCPTRRCYRKLSVGYQIFLNNWKVSNHLSIFCDLISSKSR